MEFDNLSHRVLGCALEVHKILGPGLLETTYEHALAYELTQAGLEVQTQVAVPVTYKTVTLDCGFRLDLIVNRELIVEVKSVDTLHPIHDAQILTYLKLTRLKTGLLINFNVPLLRHGLKRFVL